MRQAWPGGIIPFSQGYEQGGVLLASNLVRWGGLAGVVSGMMFVLAAIVNLIAPHHRGVFNSFSDYLYQLLAVVAFTLTLVAIAGLHALHGGNARYGRSGAAGALVAFVGYALIAMITAASMLVGAEALQSVRLVSAAAVLIGSILLGAMAIRARVVPWWCGVLIIVGFPLGDISNAVVRGGEVIVLGIVWGLVGYALLSQRSMGAGQPSRPS
jgi:hypothetical protein